jgi:hypothetical protein
MTAPFNEELVTRIYNYRVKQDRKQVAQIVHLNTKYDQAFFAPSDVYCDETDRYLFRVNILDGGGESDHTEFSAFGKTLKEAYANTEQKIDEYFEKLKEKNAEQLLIQKRIDDLLK